MRRIPLVLATAVVTAFGLAGTPAQAHDGWGYGPQQWREIHWRGHEWREHHEPCVTIIRGSHIYH
jgi:hypothetical protein